MGTISWWTGREEGHVSPPLFIPGGQTMFPQWIRTVFNFGVCSLLIIDVNKLECINTKKLFCSLDCNIAKHVFLCFDSIVYNSIVYIL